MRTSGRIIERTGGASPLLQLGLLKIGARLSQALLGGHGFGRYVDVISRFFRDGNLMTFQVFGDGRVTVPMYDAYWLAHLMTGRAYEPEVAKVLGAILEPDSAFIDCGANIGYWSLMASTRIRRPDRVVAIEASEHLYGLLLHNAVANGSPYVAVHAAVWSAPQQTLLIASDRRRHSWGSVDPAVRSALELDGFESSPVVSTTVDAQVDSMHDPGLTVVKIDVEGAEMEVLAGASETLQRNHLLIYEEHGRDRQATLSRALADHGLSLFHLDPRFGLRSVDATWVANQRPDRARGYNFFACRPGSPVYSLLERIDVLQD